MCCETVALYRTVFMLYAGSGVAVAAFLAATFGRAMLADPKVSALRRQNPETTDAILGALGLAFAAVLAAGWPMTLLCWALLRFVVVPRIMAAEHRRHSEEGRPKC